WPDGQGRPPVSNLNFSAGETIPNLVVVKVGSGGRVDFYNGSAGTVQVIADVSGWFTTGSPAAGGLSPLTPARIMDTRHGLGAAGPVGPGQTVKLAVFNKGKLPGSGIGAVV